jgi:hypothetical protein
MARQVLAHLIELQDEGRVTADDIARAMTERESAIMNPHIDGRFDARGASVAAEELGASKRIDVLHTYRLIAG